MLLVGFIIRVYAYFGSQSSRSAAARAVLLFNGHNLYVLYPVILVFALTFL